MSGDAYRTYIAGKTRDEPDTLANARPCPLCAGTDLATEDWLDDTPDGGEYGEVVYIRCARCYCTAPAKNWNRRAGPEAAN